MVWMVAAEYPNLLLLVSLADAEVFVYKTVHRRAAPRHVPTFVKHCPAGLRRLMILEQKSTLLHVYRRRGLRTGGGGAVVA